MGVRVVGWLADLKKFVLIFTCLCCLQELRGWINLVQRILFMVEWFNPFPHCRKTPPTAQPQVAIDLAKDDC